MNACQERERRNQAERRKSRFFHKSLRLLNITKAPLLQALTETPSKLFRPWANYLLASEAANY
ncbi:MAG: hypothetical protein DME67_00425 [Verrucomicrobia bacterium]|nr:MAG: hypothetical protein DME67_00425 [Verrucomicrobiota bacterium]